MKSLMIKAAKAAGKVILKDFGKLKKFKYKEPRSIVTKTDILAEKVILKTIMDKFPNHNFLTEESEYKDNKSEYTWIIDPIDGTNNFVSNISEFGVSIALAKNNEVIHGIVFNPCSDELFYAEKGKGSYLNNKRLKVSVKNKFSDSVLAFNLPSDIKISRKSLAILSKTYGTFRALRNGGSAALNMCYLTDNKFDVYFSLDISSWDVAASKLIVEEANGKITNLNNKRWDINDKIIIGSNKILHNKFIRLIK